MDAFDAPMTACRAGNALDVEGRRADVQASIEAAAVGIFGARSDLEQGFDVGEAGRPWIAALRDNPIDFGRGSIYARLDATVPLFNGRFANELGGRSSAEIVLDVGFQRRLIAFQGKPRPYSGGIDIRSIIGRSGAAN